MEKRILKELGRLFGTANIENHPKKKFAGAQLKDRCLAFIEWIRLNCYIHDDENSCWSIYGDELETQYTDEQIFNYWYDNVMDGYRGSVG